MSNHDRLTAALVALTDKRANGENLPSMEQIAETAGVELSVAREVFTDEKELMIAVAEVAMTKLVDWSTRNVVAVDPEDPIEQMIALGYAYLDFAFADLPTFRVINDRRYVDFIAQPRLNRYVDAMRRLVLGLIERARAIGRLASDDDTDLLLLAARSYVYGLARMAADDHFREWVPETEPLELSKRAFRDYIERVVGDNSSAAARETRERPAPVSGG